jgi:SAM-dependent methyltransferase
MAGLDHHVLATGRAFDSIATGYDTVVAPNRMLQAIRDRTRAAVAERVPPGGRLLDLGCGSGLDAVWFGHQGYRVLAIDGSRAMVEGAQRRVSAEGLAPSIDVQHCAIEEIDCAGLGEFDAVYSDLGPMNCVDDLASAARTIAGVLQPDGALVASVMARVCIPEIALYAARGRFARASVRFAKGAVPVPLGGGVVATRYYNPREFQRPFVAAGLVRESLRGVGTVVPPPYCDAFAARRPALVAALQRIDAVVGAWPIIRVTGDHFVIVLRKTDGRVS